MQAAKQTIESLHSRVDINAIDVYQYCSQHRYLFPYNLVDNIRSGEAETKPPNHFGNNCKYQPRNFLVKFHVKAMKIDQLLLLGFKFVVDSLFIAAGALCLVLVLLFTGLCPSSFAIILIGKNKLVPLLSGA